MTLHKNNYLNIMLWFTVLVVPFLLQITRVINTYDYSISPRNGFISIITGCFMHGNWKHLISNLVVVLLSASIIYQYYRKLYIYITILGIIIPAYTMYYLNYDSVGISGMGFAYVWFIIVRGLMSRDPIRFKIGLFMLVFYGMTLSTAIPLDPSQRIAWQAHLAGLLTGFFVSLFSRLKKLD